MTIHDRRATAMRTSAADLVWSPAVARWPTGGSASAANCLRLGHAIREAFVGSVQALAIAPIVTLSDGRCQGDRAPGRRSVRSGSCRAPQRSPGQIS